MKFSYDEEDKTDSDEVKNFFLDRSLVEDEFEVIWETQKSISHLDLNDHMKEDIKKSIFDQRPLKSQRETIGKCSFETYYDDGRKIPFADRHIRANKGLVSFEIYRLHILPLITWSGHYTPTYTLESNQDLLNY